MKDNLFIGEEARKSLIAGVNKVADAVGRTMGTAGQNSLLQTIEDPGHFPTNDGWQIANSVKLADDLEDMGRRVLLESVNRANRASGDGSSTTCVLTAAILEKGLQTENKSPMEIKRSLESYIPIIEEAIRKQVRKVGVNELSAVASTSAENKDIGDRIQEIYQKIGKDGVIHWEAGKSPEDSYQISSGIKIDGATYASRYMCDVDNNGQIQSTIRWKNAPVFLYHGKITSSAPFDSIMQQIFEQGEEQVLIFCDDIEAVAINDFVMSRMKLAKGGRKFAIATVKMPVIFNDEWWEDLRVATGADIVGPHPSAVIQQLKNATFSNLGRIGNVIVTSEDTYLDGFADAAKFNTHILNIRAGGEDKDLQRAERLNTMTARYFVGGYSPNAIGYRRMKVEDAINAASCALEEGIVAGGGVALLNVARLLESETNVGAEILRYALEVPTRKILTNGGWNVDNITKVGGEHGIDSRTGRKINMFDAGIVDAAPVLVNAVRNAIGVAATILTIGNVVLLPRDEMAERVMQAQSLAQMG